MLQAILLQCLQESAAFFCFFLFSRNVINIFNKIDSGSGFRIGKEIPSSASVLRTFCRAGFYAGLCHEVLIIAVQLWISVTGSLKKVLLATITEPYMQISLSSG